jgi:hypothetical protein
MDAIIQWQAICRSVSLRLPWMLMLWYGGFTTVNSFHASDDNLAAKYISMPENLINADSVQSPNFDYWALCYSHSLRLKISARIA